MSDAEAGLIERMPFRPYKRFVSERFGLIEYHKRLQKAALESGADEMELAANGGRTAVLASIRRHMPDFDSAQAQEVYAPAWAKLKPILVRAGLSPVDETTTLTDIKAFLDSARVAQEEKPDRGEQAMAGNRTISPPPHCNLAVLAWLIDLEKNPDGDAAGWELSQINELPEIQLLAEKIGLCRPGKFSSATVRAIATRLSVQRSLNLQEANGISLSRVVTLLREQLNASENEAAMPDARNVFVIHGRNVAARDAMFEFLRALGLNPIEWSEAVKMTGKGSPYIGEILDAAFTNAQAIVAVLTGDDLAHLRPEFHESHDPDHEKTLTPQARPNVLFEAGMAFGRRADRTIMVQIGSLRPFSDVAGRHTLQYTGTPANRHELRDRLKTASCAVKEGGTDWLHAGNFDAAVKLATVSKPVRRRKA
jgi:predicted nucleotide-binding protein